ncbi:MAG: DMT family transporter [Clostridia bacterium]|nr:DMT family transporter [Clostridia bacterium]
MQAILIILMVLIISAQNVLRKDYNKKTNDKGTYLFLGILSFTAALSFLIFSGFSLKLLPELIPYSLAIAVTYSAANYFPIRAFAIGPLSLSSLIGAFSLVVPTTFGIVFYGEPISPLYIIGAVFLVASIFLTNSTAKGEKKLSFKWALFCVLGAVCNGVFSVVQSLQQRAFEGLYKNELMFCALLLSSLFFFNMSFVKEREEIKECIKHSWSAAAVGASSGIGNLFKMILMSIMNMSLIFPLINAGGIIVTAVVAVLLYREKLSMKQYAGIACGVITIIFIGL